MSTFLLSTDGGETFKEVANSNPTFGVNDVDEAIHNYALLAAKHPTYHTAVMQGATRAFIAMELSDLKGESLFAEAIRTGVKTNLNGVLKMITEQAKDNYGLVCDIVGKELTDKIIKL